MSEQEEKEKLTDSVTEDEDRNQNDSNSASKLTTKHSNAGSSSKNEKEKERPASLSNVKYAFIENEESSTSPITDTTSDASPTKERAVSKSPSPDVAKQPAERQSLLASEDAALLPDHLKEDIEHLELDEIPLDEGVMYQSPPRRYARALKTFIPIRPKSDRPKLAFPSENVGLLSYISYNWLTKIMWRLYKEGKTPDEMWNCPEHSNADVSMRRIEKLWHEELKNKGPEKASVGWVLFRFIKTRFIVSTIIFLFMLVFSFLGPAFLVRSILEHAQFGGKDLGHGFALVAGLFISEMGRSVSFAVVWAINYESGIRVRGGALSLIFKKILKLRSLKDKSVGEMVNLCANDGQRLFEATILGGLILGGPLIATAAIVYCVHLIGPAALVGLSVFLLFYPFQVLVSRLTSHFRRKCIVITDSRVRMMNEVLTCAKLIKMYAWEKSFAKTISGIRSNERNILEKSAYVQSFSIAATPLVPIIAAVLTFIVHAQTGNDLTAAQVYTMLGITHSMRFQVYILPNAVKALSECFIVLSRIKSVLLMEEITPHRWRVPKPHHAVFMSNATLAWDVSKSENKENEDKKKKDFDKKKSKKVSLEEAKLKDDLKEEEEKEFVKTLFNIHLVLEKGKLMGVCGSVGSGKSSLLSAVLAQMKLISGEVAVNGSIAYVVQQAWIINATVRENILFGEDFDKERYDAAIFACNLSEDLEQLTDGDQTEIGERGINLSGGQKQRISLARAVYSNKDIYLLDDPLSAVDTHVGKHIFENCLKVALKGKTVLFVTHQLQYLNQCDYVLYMKDGRIAERGTHEELMEQSGEYAGLVSTMFTDTREGETGDEVDPPSSPLLPSSLPNSSGGHSMHRHHPLRQVSSDTTGRSQRYLSQDGHLSASAVRVSPERIEERHSMMLSSMTSLASGMSEPHVYEEDAGKLIEAEESEQGHVKFSTYKAYFRAAGGYLISILVISLFVISVGCTAFSNWWLSYWLRQGSGGLNVTVGNMTVMSDNITDNPQLNFYTFVYGMTIIAILVTACVRGFIFMKTTLHASSSLHDSLFLKVFRSPMKFFDTTPTGRILNRFSKDLDEVDVMLPFLSEQYLQNMCLILASLCMIASVFQWFLIAVVPLIAVFIFLYICFRVGIRELKRLDNTTRSPLFSHITATIQGLSTIHAYQKNEQFLKKFKQLMDENTVPYFMFNCAMRWLAVRLDILTILITTITGILVIITPTEVIPPALAGLALSYAIQMTGLFQFTIRLSIETEARFTSVERIQHYIQNLESEAEAVVEENRPPANWPSEGQITFQRVKMKYRHNLPLVLKGISFEIKPRKKIGIVGRTGSGKSSLGVSLFRLVELSAGKIVIDDIDISSVGLDDLRSKLAIIPQDPVLFVGTVRYNLDPFQQHTDQELWEAIEKCHVKDTIQELEGQLEAPVVENGENFSVGERQLICMARALLRHSKILMLDEATAAIDTETDALIQETIKEAFKDCTMLTIAHRLNTVLGCDKIMVLDDGKVVEYDTPAKLLSEPDSIFSHMVAAMDAEKQMALENVIDLSVPANQE